ncbi:hypothetical protein IMF23_12690 [Chelatococcus daeguensis]|uniref:hypothetical protein n=1 Tax=Chelatococcus daeguensis TaxID=444444 RepID=UPI0007ABD318|nr:hypothetical protein [Chelatococcus daeguensis]KZE36232.1 hypothetical protein AVW15_10645 [Chelatococcus daeguensis]MBM3084297.1 hypothetical protein [Chelatococcus daeguensis]
MLITADEVARSLRGCWQVLNRSNGALETFDVSFTGFWHSFLAMALAAPAFVVGVAAARFTRSGPDWMHDGGLFDMPDILFAQALVIASAWLLFPLLMLGFVRLMGLERRYVGYIVAYNWSNVAALLLLALPPALHVLGLATAGLAVFYALAFGFIVFYFRWVLARIALGISAGLAGFIVAMDIATFVLVRTFVG